MHIAAADVKALSYARNTVTKPLGCVLDKPSIFNTKARKIVVEQNEICLNNCCAK